MKKLTREVGFYSCEIHYLQRINSHLNQQVLEKFISNVGLLHEQLLMPVTNQRNFLSDSDRNDFGFWNF